MGWFPCRHGLTGGQAGRPAAGKAATLPQKDDSNHETTE